MSIIFECDEKACEAQTTVSNPGAIPEGWEETERGWRCNACVAREAAAAAETETIMPRGRGAE